MFNLCIFHRRNSLNKEEVWTFLCFFAKFPSFISTRNDSFQWWIQDFPEEGAPNPKGAPSCYFINLFLTIAWKWRNFGLGSREGPPRSANVIFALPQWLICCAFISYYNNGFVFLLCICEHCEHSNMSSFYTIEKRIKKFSAVGGVSGKTQKKDVLRMKVTSYLALWRLRTAG